MTEWQPIETAPKDGTDIIGYLPDSEHVTTIVWQRFQDGFHWVLAEDWNYGINPTHWQPLPEPPTEASP